MECVAKLKTRLAPPARTGLPGRQEAPCSVLIPIGIRAEDATEEILLTKRTLQVETHKGQVSFPGGFVEPRDTSLLDTALRESFEEIGLLPKDVEILGRLSSVATRGGVQICPWVGVFPLPYDFHPNPIEVERVLYLPLLELLERGVHPVQVPVGAARVASIGIEVDGELVWGATARMLHDLRELLLMA